MPSSYFSPPSDHLDPCLFEGDKIRDEVRAPLIQAINESLIKEGLSEPDSWLHLWLTGSAISYQWEADRGNGDLDVQLGFDYDLFVQANTGYRGVDPYHMSDMINRYLRENLWPLMSQATFQGKQYEVTFFWNSLVGSNIEYIHPYAAYDLLEDDWIVRPPQLPDDPRSLYPEQWHLTAETDLTAAQTLSQRHAEASAAMVGTKPGSPLWLNHKAFLQAVNSQARSLYDDIHQGRALAFTMGGHGYKDWHNFRWQSAKDSGAIDVLKGILKPADEEKKTQEIALYGAPVKSADEALEEALTFRMGKRYDG